MGEVLNFPVRHRRLILEQSVEERVLKTFRKAAKRLGLTVDSIYALPPLPRNYFLRSPADEDIWKVTLAALCQAEKRGELPEPVKYRGKFCYPIADLISIQLGRIIAKSIRFPSVARSKPVYPVRGVKDSESLHIHFLAKAVSDLCKGDQRALELVVAGVWVPKRSWAQINADHERMLDKFGLREQYKAYQKVFEDVVRDYRSPQ